MIKARPLAALLIAAALGGVAIVGVQANAQRGVTYIDAGDTRAAFGRAQADARAAAGRARQLEMAAKSSTEAAQKSATEAAALAARVQEAEAGIAAADARIALAHSARVRLDQQLAERRGPLLALTAGLQKLARRPLALAVLRPGSLKETVYLRAMLDSTLPEVRRRTAALRGEIARGQRIEAEARAARLALQQGRRQLAERRGQLAALEARQRIAARQASGAAAREGERALALAEQARDLDQLAIQLDAAGALRRQLAALPGPVLRPAQPGVGSRPPVADAPSATTAAPRFAAQLPVSGRIASGFGVAGADGVKGNGILLATAAGAQVVAPAAGRVAFAGPFRGFGRIVIIEHAGGFASLMTGLARADVQVGQQLVAGAPVGIAGTGAAGAQPVVGFELRAAGTPVNPLRYLR